MSEMKILMNDIEKCLIDSGIEITTRNKHYISRIYNVLVWANSSSGIKYKSWKIVVNKYLKYPNYGNRTCVKIGQTNSKYSKYPERIVWLEFTGVE
jgi:hypothetical protein